MFRDDLYYRICTLKIDIPPLRDRPEDILLLAQHFIHRHESQQKKKITITNPETKQAILKYHWPGNIRQLENAVERAMHLSEGETLLPEHFGIATLNEQEEPMDLAVAHKGQTLGEIEKQVLISTLNDLNGNIRKAAMQLDISRPTIYRKLKQYGLSCSRRKVF